MRKPWIEFVVIAGALLASTAQSQQSTDCVGASRELYCTAVENRDPEYCFTLKNPDYQMLCRAQVGDVGVDCNEVNNDEIRAACHKAVTQ